MLWTLVYNPTGPADSMCNLMYDLQVVVITVPLSYRICESLVPYFDSSSSDSRNVSLVPGCVLFICSLLADVFESTILLFLSFWIELNMVVWLVNCHVCLLFIFTGSCHSSFFTGCLLFKLWKASSSDPWHDIRDIQGKQRKWMACFMHEAVLLDILGFCVDQNNMNMPLDLLLVVIG